MTNQTKHRDNPILSSVRMTVQILVPEFCLLTTSKLQNKPILNNPLISHKENMKKQNKANFPHFQLKNKDRTKKQTQNCHPGLRAGIQNDSAGLPKCKTKPNTAQERKISRIAQYFINP
jgi:hypothetical protein